MQNDPATPQGLVNGWRRNFLESKRTSGAPASGTASVSSRLFCVAAYAGR